MATGKTVLIVDDSEGVRQMLRALLEDVADGFIECADGALAAYRKHRPAWVLMDIQMTVMDGLAATREIMAAFPQARIIIVTQHGDAQTRAAALSERRPCVSSQRRSARAPGDHQPAGERH